LAVIALALIFGAVFWRNAGVVPAEELTVAPNLDGPENAPVRIVEFGDFGCPSCRAWHNAGIHQQIRADFGDQVSFEFRHFPVITPQSPQAAEAAQCAGEQGTFWEYHDYIYEQTPQGALSIADLKSYAVAIGLDQETFDSCLDSGKYSDYINQDMRAAQAAGARGTPSFFIDGQPVPFSYAGMAVAIEAALANQ
jgi:protein-disulfide isomerase